MIAHTSYPETVQHTSANLTAALTYARRGIPVFPCQPGGKAPLTRRGYKDASTDPETIRQWWTRWPAANIGVPTGERSGILALDVDLDKGGFESLDALTSSLPDTYTVRTGRGGAHFYFRYPPGSGIGLSSGDLPPGLDIRGEGGHVVVPPSHTTGPYTVVDDQPLAAPLEWLLEPLRSQRRASVSAIPRPKSQVSPVFCSGPIPEGSRNVTLTSIAGRLRAQGHDDASLFTALEQANEDKCTPPLPAPEVHKIARSVCRYPVGVPAREPDPETLEALDVLEAMIWERSWPGRGGKSERDIMIVLLLLSQRHGESLPAGVRVSVSYRALALLAAVSLSTVFRAVKRMKKAGLLRADNLGRLPEEAGAFVLVAGTPATSGYSPTTAAPPGVEGVSSKRHLRGAGSRSTFTAPRLRWSAPGIRRLGKSAGQVVDTLEAAGGSLTLEELADRTGSKRPRDLRRRTLPRLIEAGVVVAVSGDVVALSGDWRESLEVERERAGENAAYRRDADRYQREREAYRRRDETTPEAVPSPLRALAELERIGQERSVDSGHERDERSPESGETGEGGAGESGAEQRGEREAWTPSAAYLRMVPSEQGWAA
jgi:hypothetical protein